MSLETVARQSLYRQTRARGGELRSLADRRLLSRIWRFAQRHHRKLAVFLAVSVVSALLTVATPLLAGRVVDEITGPGVTSVVVMLAAVIAVVASHMNHEVVPGGFLGVDVFFVISGYVITASLAHRASPSAANFLLGFYERRVKRLTPALVCCVVLTAVALCLFDPTPSSYLKTGQAALFGFSNVALYRNSLNYFGHGAELDTFTQTWSLGVEEQFYFLYPVFAWASGFGREVKHGRARLAALVVGLAGVSLFWFVRWHRTSFEASYFLMPSRFWELAAGCLLCLMQEEVASTVAVFRDGAWQLDTMWVLLPMCFLFFSPARLRVPATIAEVVLTCVIIATASPGTAGYTALTQKPMMYFGRVSYSLYLWHWPVISIARRTNLAPRRGGWTALAHVPIMLLLSHASYACIEKPFRHAAWSSRKGLSLLYGLTAMSAAFGLLVWLQKSPGAADALYLDEPCTPGRKETCTTPNSVHMEIFPHISGSEITPETCFFHLRYTGLKEDTIPRCIRRTDESSQKIFVYGDSYAAHLGLLVNSLVDLHPMELHYLPVEGCDYDGTAKIYPHEPEHPDRWHWQCNEINEQRREHLAQRAAARAADESRSRPDAPAAHRRHPDPSCYIKKAVDGRPLCDPVLLHQIQYLRSVRCIVQIRFSLKSKGW